MTLVTHEVDPLAQDVLFRNDEWSAQRCKQANNSYFIITIIINVLNKKQTFFSLINLHPALLNYWQGKNSSADGISP